VFNASCIVYTGTDITCNGDVVISRYDYMDTVVTKLVNYICNTVGPVTTVVGSTYVDVVPATVGNVTTYTVSVDIPALQAYFDIVIAQTIASSILAGPGINVDVNPITSAVTVSHQDTSSVANLNSDNSGNSFIQDIFFTFDTFGHVTGASVVPGSVIQPNDFDRAQINPDSGFVWGPDNDPTNIQIAEAPGDTLNFVAGAGITLNASTVPGTDAIRITNSSPASAVSLTSAGGLGTESLVNDGAGPTLANKGLAAGSGVTLTSTATDVTITNAAPDQIVSLTPGTGIGVSGSYPNFTITNTDSGGSAITLTSAGGIATLVNDGTGPTLATKGLSPGQGISLTSTGTDVTIASTGPRKHTAVSSGPIAPGGIFVVTHNLNTIEIVVSAISATLPSPFISYLQGIDYTYVLNDNNQISLSNISSNTMGDLTVTVIG
jgi:hypothetical protein